MPLDIRMLLEKSKQYGKQLVDESVESAKNLPHAREYYRKMKANRRILELPSKDKRVSIGQSVADKLHAEYINNKEKFQSAMKLPLAGLGAVSGYKAIKTLGDPKIPHNYVEAPTGQYLTEEELLKASAFDFRRIIGATAARFRNRATTGSSVAEQAAASIMGKPKIKPVASSFDAAKARAVDVPFSDVHSNVQRPFNPVNGIVKRPKGPDVEDIKFKDVKPAPEPTIKVAPAKASAPKPTIEPVPAPGTEPKKSGIGKYIVGGTALGVGALALGTGNSKKKKEYNQ